MDAMNVCHSYLPLQPSYKVRWFPLNPYTLFAVLLLVVQCSSIMERTATTNATPAHRRRHHRRRRSIYSSLTTAAAKTNSNRISMDTQQNTLPSCCFSAPFCHRTNDVLRPRSRSTTRDKSYSVSDCWYGTTTTTLDFYPSSSFVRRHYTPSLLRTTSMSTMTSIQDSIYSTNELLIASTTTTIPNTNEYHCFPSNVSAVLESTSLLLELSVVSLLLWTIYYLYHEPVRLLQPDDADDHGQPAALRLWLSPSSSCTTDTRVGSDSESSLVSVDTADGTTTITTTAAGAGVINTDEEQTQITQQFKQQQQQQQQRVDVHLSQINDEIDGVEGDIESLRDQRTNRAITTKTTTQPPPPVTEVNFDSQLRQLNDEIDGVEAQIKSSWEAHGRIQSKPPGENDHDDTGEKEEMVSRPKLTVDDVVRRTETRTDTFVKNAILQWDALQSMNQKGGTGGGGGKRPVLARGSTRSASKRSTAQTTLAHDSAVGACGSVVRDTPNTSTTTTIAIQNPIDCEYQSVAAANGQQRESHVLRVDREEGQQQQLPLQLHPSRIIVEPEIHDHSHETLRDDVGDESTHSTHTTHDHGQQQQQQIQKSKSATNHDTEIGSLLQMFQNHHPPDRPHPVQSGGVVGETNHPQKLHETHQFEVAQMLAASAYKEEIERQEKLRERKVLGHDRARELRDQLDHDVGRMKLHARQIKTRRRGAESTGKDSSIQEPLIVVKRGISKQIVINENDGRCPPSRAHIASKSLLQKTSHQVGKTKSLVNVAEHGIRLNNKGNIHQVNKAFHSPSTKVSRVRNLPRKVVSLKSLFRRKNGKSKLMARIDGDSEPCNASVERRIKDKLKLVNKPDIVETSLPFWSLLTKRKIIIPALLIALGRGAIKTVVCMLI